MDQTPVNGVDVFAAAKEMEFTLALLLFNKLLSLFAVIALGFATARTGLIKPDEAKSLSLLSLYIVCPIAVMNAFEVNCTPEILSGMLLAVVFSLVTHAVYIGMMRILKKPLKLSDIERASVCYPNAGILTIPLVSAMLGDEWIIYTCAYNLVQTVLMWTHLRMLLSGEKTVDIKKIVLNPNIIATAVGVVIFFTGMRFPGPVDSAVDSIAAMIGPLGMLITGITIGGMPLKRLVSFKRVWFVVFIRLIIMPLIMAVIAKTFMTPLHPEGQTVLMVSMLAASGPCASTVMQMSQLYNDRRTAEYAGALNVISMVFCSITMPLIIAFYYL